MDPDELADRMTPEMMDERIAHYNLEPWGDEWTIGAMIAAEVCNGITRAIYARGGKTPGQDELVRPIDFVPLPKWLLEQQGQRKYLTDEEAERELRKMC